MKRRRSFENGNNNKKQKSNISESKNDDDDDINNAIMAIEEDNPRIIVLGVSTYNDVINWYNMLSEEIESSSSGGGNTIVITLNNGNVMSAHVISANYESAHNIDFLKFGLNPKYNEWQVLNTNISDRVTDIFTLDMVTLGTSGLYEMSVRGANDRYDVAMVEINATSGEIRNEIINAFVTHLNINHPAATHMYDISKMAHMARIVHSKK